MTPSSHASRIVVIRLLLTGVIVLASAVHPSVSEEVPTIVPGDARLDGSVTPGHTARWRLSRLTPDGVETDQGLWMDRHELVERDGRRLVRFQSDVLRHGEAYRRDLIFRDARTLEPVVAEFDNYNREGGWAYFDYDGPSFTVVFRRGPWEETLSDRAVLERRVFDPGQGAMLLNFVQPEVGTAFRYPYHDRVDDGVKWATVRVVDEELSPFEGGTRLLIVENSFGWKYWWLPRPPYVVRLEIPRAAGEIDRWELLDYAIGP